MDEQSVSRQQVCLFLVMCLAMSIRTPNGVMIMEQ